MHFNNMNLSLLISNSGFVEKIVAKCEVANRGTELIQKLYLGHESWLLIGQYC